MPFLDFFDFLTNSVLMPISAILICLYVTKCMGLKRVEEEVTLGGHPFRRRIIFEFMIRWICPVFALIIMISSVANAFGWISM
jgi:NSS family neurotransmitter:Na+ symporter